MGLVRYRQKRNFTKTKEPRGLVAKKSGRSFVVQKHAASRLHYDFRLELDGVLLSWAVPKGPSLDPQVKRLAVQTEDHPVAYGGFEGTIPKGEYGGGSVVVWDRGTWEPDGDPHEMYEKGRLTFTLDGEKLHGAYHLVKTRGGRAAKDAKSQWLLIKRNDDVAKPGSDSALVDDAPNSVISGKSVEEVANDPGRVWGPNGEEAAKKKPRKAAARSTARKAHTPAEAHSTKKRTAVKRAAGKSRVPDFIEPQLATLVDAAPEGDAFIHEMKLDGYRILARVDQGEVSLSSRRGNDWTSRLPTIARAVGELALEDGILDGEIVVLGENGVSSFQALQNSLQEPGETGKGNAIVYFVFDAPFLNGEDLRMEPLVDRKKALAAVLGKTKKTALVRLSEHVVGGGPEFFEQACKLGLEGIVSKRADAPYVSTRSKTWLKVKCTKRQEFVIGGYTEPSNSRQHFGALLVGVREKGALVYAGKVGTGFTAESLRELKSRFSGLEQKTSPFDPAPRGAKAKGVHWLAPKLVGEVEFAERTSDGMLRHASFQGLRDDKSPKDVVREDAAPVPSKDAAPSRTVKTSKRAGVSTRRTDILVDPSKIKLTHPDKVLYAEQGITKGDLALYYAQVADRMLPHVVDRPLMIVRCPEGTAKQCFHQKHPSKGMPHGVGTVLIQEKEEKKGSLPHLKIEDATGIIGLVQMGALEIHTWGCREGDLNRPDQLVFDLDPDEDLPWSRVAEAAQSIREDLEAIGLTGFLKTTGGKGLHVVTPLVPSATWDEAKAFCKKLVQARVAAEPARYLAVMTKEKRKGKIFLDYLRNGRGATSVCAFSTRARAGATVSTPITWDELDAKKRPVFDIQNVPPRAKKADPWEGFDDARAKLPRSK